MAHEPAWLYPSRPIDRSLKARLERAIDRRRARWRRQVPPLLAVVRESSTVSGKRATAIAADVLAAWRRDGISPKEYASYRLWDVDDIGRRDFVRSPELDAFLVATSERADRALFLDKTAFAEHAGKAGIPAIATLGVVNRREGVVPARAVSIDDPARLLAALAELSAVGDLILKPAVGKQGIGVFRVARGGAAASDADGRDVSAAALAESVFAYRHPAGAFGYIVQPLLAAHPTMVELVGMSELATLRVITAVRNGSADVVRAFLKLSAPGRLTNNFRGGVTGSLLSALDPSSGRLGELVGLLSPGRRFALESVATHPTTGRRIAGAELPAWRDALDISRRGALAHPRTATLGWDIAYGTSGWQVLEVNTSWGAGGPQAATSRGLRGDLASFFPEHWRR